MKRIALLITLALMLSGSALAQSVRTTPTEPLWGGFPLNVYKMSGMEVSPGTIDYVDSVCWGRTFLMMNDSGNFTFMPNYTVDFASEPGTTYSKVTGGAWTLAYKSGKTDGMLFGEIVSGEIEWTIDKGGNYTFGVVVAYVNIKGGTGSFGYVTGQDATGTFNGEIDLSSGHPEVRGSLELLF